MRKDTNSVRAVNLAGEMTRRFGGVQKFAELWHAQLWGLCAQKPGSRAALNGLMALIKLIQHCSEARPKRNLDDFTDEEIESEIQAIRATADALGVHR